MVSGASAGFQQTPRSYTLVYQRNHGRLPHGSNTLLHGTNSGGTYHFAIGNAAYRYSRRRLPGAALARGLAVARSKSVAPEIRGNGRAASAVGPPMLFAGRLWSWRPRPELNRGTRFCRPLRNHSATWPCAASNGSRPALRRPAIQDRVRAGNHPRTARVALLWPSLSSATAPCLFHRATV
jgi:hypothetical protein